MNESLLFELGLTQNEVKTYLALLELGSATTSKVIERAHISSGKIYETLTKLRQKGLVSVTQVNGVHQYTPTHPEALTALVHEKKEALEQKEVQLRDLIPKLTALRSETMPGTVANTVTGVRAVRTLIAELFKNAKTPIYAMGIRGNKKPEYNRFWWQITYDLLEKHKKPTLYLFSENTSEYYRMHTKLKHVQVRSTSANTPIAIDLVDDHTLILTYGEDIECIDIWSKPITESFRAFFLQLWEDAKIPLSKNKN